MVLDVFFFCTATCTNSSFKSHYFLPFLNPHKKVLSTGVKFPKKRLHIPHAKVIMDKFDRLHVPLLSSLTIPSSQPNKNRKSAAACYQNSRLSLLFLAGIPSITTKNSQILHPTNCFHLTSQKLSIPLRLYFHDALEQLKTNFHTNFRFKRVLGFVIEYA